MKIKFHLDTTERRYVCEFLLNVNRDKIKAIIENYRRYKYDGNNTFNNLDIDEVFAGVVDIATHMVCEKEIVEAPVDTTLAFYYWLGAQCEDDTFYVLGCERDNKAVAIDRAMSNLYGDLDQALEAYSFGYTNY